MPNRKELVVVGAGAHARVVMDTAMAAGFAIRGLLDPAHMPGTVVNTFHVLGSDDLLQDEQFVSAHQFVVAIGDQETRRKISERLVRVGALATIVHPSCVVSPSATIGAGSTVLAGCIVNANASVGRFCILNTACSVDHDCILEDGVQVSPGARLAGNVTCGADVFIGTAAVIIPKVAIGTGAIVGAGAVVVNDVDAYSTVVGNPARPKTGAAAEGDPATAPRTRKISASRRS